MYRKFRILCICFLFCPVVFAAEQKNNLTSELQILIDVSGSMKQTDPKNLRIPALKLLINLLPKGSKAGVWLFAQDTKVLVKTAVVSAKWKRQALAKISKIHSRGLFTNIEEAIKFSAEDWFSSSSAQTVKKMRHLILLTDGMIDVSKDIMQSAESRDRIMVNQIPLLQQAGVKVHTIALSNNADLELMEKLAFDTDGWSEMAQSARQLEKVFFKIFKKAVPQDTVPLKGNTFTIDQSIKEFSVLVFKKAGASETKLLRPDKRKIAKSNKTKNVSWMDEKNYDLVTIKNPKQGLWRIVAELDPDNQVMIVTDLKFNVDDMPNYISSTESFSLNAFFTDQQQLISRDDFLSLIDISFTQTDPLGNKTNGKIAPVPSKAGLFSATMGTFLTVGKHTIRIEADGKTFKRERVQTIEMIKSLVTVEKIIKRAERIVTLLLKPNALAINTAMMNVEVNITEIGKPVITRQAQQSNGVWTIDIAGAAKGERKIVNFSIMAKSIAGQSISPNVRAVIINDELFSKKEVQPVSLQIKTISEIEQIDEEEEDQQDSRANEEDEDVEEEQGVNWIKTSIIVLSLNVFFIAGGFFLLRFMKKKAAEKQAQLLDRLA